LFSEQKAEKTVVSSDPYIKANKYTVAKSYKWYPEILSFKTHKLNGWGTTLFTVLCNTKKTRLSSIKNVF